MLARTALMTMDLLHSLFQREFAAQRVAPADFVVAVRASNDEPIPLDVIVHLDLRFVSSNRDVDMIERDCRRKAALLAPDRRLAGFVCTLGELGDGRGASCLAGIAAATACFTRERAPPTVNLILFDVTDIGVPEDFLHCAPAADLIGCVTLANDPGPTCRGLTRVGAATAPSQRGFTVWVRQPAARLSPPATDAQLRAAGGAADTLYLLPLYAAGAGSGEVDDGIEATVGDSLGEYLAVHGFERTAPGLYVRGPAARSGTAARITRLLKRLYDTDVLGVGAGAVSQLEHRCFTNLASAETFRTDILGGGYGIVEGAFISDSQLFVGNLLARLAGGAEIDVRALALSYRSLSADFHSAVHETLHALARADALAMRAGRIRLLPRNDSEFGAVARQLWQVARTSSATTVVNFRAP